MRLPSDVKWQNTPMKENPSRRLPHDGVSTRLKPSKIHGVGVFAMIDIPKGTYAFTDDDEPIVWVDKSTVETLPRALKEFYYRFAIIKGSEYGCPASFNELTTSWYLNHSDYPIWQRARIIASTPFEISEPAKNSR